MKIFLLLIVIGMIACGEDEFTSKRQVSTSEDSVFNDQDNDTALDIDSDQLDDNAIDEQHSNHDVLNSEITDLNNQTKTIHSLLSESEYLVLSINGINCGFCHEEAKDIQADPQLQSALSSEKCNFATVMMDGYDKEQSSAYQWNKL